LIREAVQEDVSRIVEMGSRSLREGPYSGMIADVPAQSQRLAEQVMSAPGGTILLSDEDGSATGLIAFIVCAHPFSGETVATELMWYVEPEHRPGGIGMRLLWEAEKLAKEKGALKMQFTAPTSQIGDIYRRFGYRKIEETFLKEL